MLTVEGPYSIYHIRNIELVERYIDRVPGGHAMPLHLLVDGKTTAVMNYAMKARSDLVFQKVGKRPHTGKTRDWLTWPLKEILLAWRPCIEKNSSATVALELKDLLATVTVACKFEESHAIAAMVTKMCKRPKNVPNPLQMNKPKQ